MTIMRRIAFTALAAPLALGLAACSEAEGDVAEGEAITAVAAPDGQSWTDMVEVTEADGYLLGNPDAPIKLIEYGSLTCGACANFSQSGGSEAIVEDYVSTGVVSFELRNQVHNAFDLTLARLVRCSAPESFHPLAHQIWNNFDTVMNRMQQGQGALADVGSLPEDQRFVAIAEAAGFLDFFAARGISRDQARACLADADAVMAIGDRSEQQSNELGVNSTPTFILNGRVLEERSWDDLEAVLQRAGARPAAES